LKKRRLWPKRKRRPPDRKVITEKKEEGEAAAPAPGGKEKASKRKGAEEIASSRAECSEVEGAVNHFCVLTGILRLLSAALHSAQNDDRKHDSLGRGLGNPGPNTWLRVIISDS